jgi:hypothetical protein
VTLGYWFKIVLGMLVIFVIGNVVYRTFHHAEDFINSDRAIEIPLLGASFKLGGERLGKVQGLRIERSSPRSVSGLALTVNLDDSISMSRFDHCSLTINDASRIDKNTTFICAVSADSSRLKLVPFGTVTFRPGDHQVVLLVPESVVADVRHNLATGASLNDSGDVDISGDSGSFHVRVNGRDIVSISGDSEGGAIKVFDRQGRALVDIAGDSTGGHVMVRDSTGHTRVNVKSPPPTPRKPITP